MREHIETLIETLTDAMRGERRAERPAPVEPRHRRPRRARTTYVPVRYEFASGRFAH